MSKIKCLLLLFAVTSVFAGCAVESSYRESSHWDLGTPQTFTDELAFEMKEPLVWLTVEMDFRIDEGELSWVIINPKGAELYFGTVGERESHYEKLALETVYGTWKLIINAEQVAGQVHMNWEGGK